MKVVPLIVLDRLSVVPFGWVSCADTISSERSDSSTAEFDSTVQVKVIADPNTTDSGLPLLLVRIGGEDRDGTVSIKAYYNINH